MSKRIMKSIVILLAFCGSSFAGGGLYYGGNGNLWTTGSNWELGVPTSSDWCYITYSATAGNGPVVQTGDAAVGGAVVLGWGGWGAGTTTMTIAGGSLNIANTIWIGKDDSQTQPEAPGVINISGGELTVDGYFVVSAGCNGIVNQTGGTVNSNIFVLDWIDNTTDPETGVYNLYGGTLNVANLYVRPHGLIDIEQGVMIVTDDVSWYIRDLINAGRLIAYGGKGTVIYDYDISNSGKTTVRAQTPQGGNLMINGSFESPDIPPASTSELESPVNWLVARGITMIDDSTIASNGSQFVELAPVDNSSGTFWQIMYLTPGNYILSFDYAAKAGVSGDRELLIWTYDKDSTTGNQTNVTMKTLQFNHQNNPADPNWLHAEYNVNVSLTAEFSVVVFECPAYGNSAIWLDNVTLVPDLNLLANGSFELPDIPAGTSLLTSPYSWAVYQGVTITDDAAIAADKDQFVEIASGGQFFQIMYLKPGDYSVSFNYAAKAGVAGTRSLNITTFDKENPDVGPVNVATRNLSFTHQNNPGDPNWLYAEYGFTVTNSAYETLLEIDCLGTSAEVWLDTVVVKPAVTEITDGFKLQAGTGWDIFTNSGVDYRYGPSFIINDDGSIDMWSASPPDSGLEWDWIKYKRSTDNGVTWGAETTVLMPTPGSLDSYSVCDPGVVKFGGYYYIGYTSTSNSSGLENDTFVARSTSPSGPYEKWNGSGWGGNPQPIIEYTDTVGGFGCGEPSFVVKDGVLYIYYTWITGNGLPQTRVATADATNPNWPAAMTVHGVAIQKANDQRQSFLPVNDS